MKKKLICLLMILVMCLSSTAAYAAEIAVDLETGEAVDELTTYTVKTGSDDELATTKIYNISIPADTKEVILPITFEEKGIFVSSAALSEEKDSVYLEEEIFKDAECINEIYYSSYDCIAEIPQGGTYYIKLSIDDYSGSAPTDFYSVGFASQFYSGQDRTLANKKWTCAGNIDTSKPIYYKVVVKETGSITVNTESDYSIDVTLLSSSKKALSEEVYNYDGKVVFAVTKGTYYLKVESSSELYRIKYTFGKSTEYGGTSKTKAKKMTPGATYVGYLTATDKKGTAEWYKITLTKSQKVDITFTGSVSSGDIKLEFTGGNISGSITQTISYVDTDKSFSAETWSSDKLPKGTYYIKVYKADATTSGFYKLSLKK
jgi:hypothetical protein